MPDIKQIISTEAIEGVIKTDKAITTLDASTKEFIKSVDTLNAALKKNKVSTEEINKAKKANETTTNKLTKLQKEQLAAEKALEKQRQKGLAQMAKLEQKERDLQAAIQKEVKSEQDLINKTNALVAVRKRLDVSTKKGIAEHKRLTSEIKRNTIALKNQDKAISRSQRNVGNYGSALKGVGSQLMGALGITAGLYGLVRVLGNVINTSKKFEKQSATLAGVLDVEKKEIKALTSQAIKLGGIYPTLASEVLDLQTAYARLGFTQSEIIDLTEDTILGSFALNSGLEDTALLVGAVVKSYDELSASDAGMIIDQLTKSTQNSSLNFEGLATALPKVAGAANALNIPLKRTLANLGTAIDATQDASIAGTSYRKILLSNAKANRTLAEGLDIINTSTNKVSTAQTLYGDRAAVVGLALANNIEKTEELATSIGDSLGVASRTAEKQMDTLSGSIDSVSSAWERLILKSAESDSGILKEFLDGIASVLILLGGFTSENPFADMEESIATNTILHEEALRRGNDAEAAFYKKALDSFQWYIDAKAKKQTESDDLKAKKLEELLASEEATDKKALELEQKKADKIFGIEEQLLAEIYALIHTDAEVQQRAIDKKVSELRKAGVSEVIIAEWVAAEKKRITDKAIIDSQKSDDIAWSAFRKNYEDGLKDYQEYVDAQTAIDEKKQQDDIIREEQKAAAKKELLIEGVNAGFDIYQGSLDRQIIALQTQKEYELSLNEGNKEAQAKTNEKYAKQEAAIRTKKAKADKAAAIINVAMNAALAIVSAYTTPPAPVGIALGIVMSALAAVQIAAIAAQPIPKFYKGTDSAPSGALIAGDRGREIISPKGSEPFMVDKPTMLTGLAGAKIYKNADTEKIMRGGAGYDSPDIRGTLDRNNNKLINAIKNQKGISIDRANRTITMREGNYAKKYLNAKVNGF